MVSMVYWRSYRHIVLLAGFCNFRLMFQPYIGKTAIRNVQGTRSVSCAWTHGLQDLEVVTSACQYSWRNPVTENLSNTWIHSSSPPTVLPRQYHLYASP